MRRFLIIVIPIITMIIFVFIMLSGTILKKPFGKFDDVPGSIDDIIAAVNDEDWDDAANKLNGLEKAWDKVIFRVQFSSERDEINKLSTCIARLKGAVTAQDKAGALMELYEAHNHWVELGN